MIRQRSRALVVTTISAPGPILSALAKGAVDHAIQFIVAGDTKTPEDFRLLSTEYLSIDEQVRRFPDLCAVLPTRHYARKNTGYLVAIADGAVEILETDDDNVPYDSFWRDAPQTYAVRSIATDAASPWFNAYRLFTDATIWPRGFPLEHLATQTGRVTEGPARSSRGLIVQALADDNPDVDAIYRLTRKLPLVFRPAAPVLLEPGVWCPFNSQNTRFRRDAFPLAYLPSHCSFRMTDIWRSFVAQRCLWEMGEGVIFESATVRQQRNEHDLLRDFADEVPGYLLNDRIRRTLDGCRLDPADARGNLVRCYEALIHDDLISEAEMPVVRAWTRECERLTR